MKCLLQVIILLISVLTLTAQSYEFSIVSDDNNTGDSYDFAFVVTPDFTNAAPNFADIQVNMAITSGNSIQAASFTELLGTGWQMNTALMGSALQGFGIGDESRDLWVFSLPVPTSALSTPHTSGVGIPLFSFVVDNSPTTGEITILENNDALATGLAGIGFVVGNVIDVSTINLGVYTVASKNNVKNNTKTNSVLIAET